MSSVTLTTGKFVSATSRSAGMEIAHELTRKASNTYEVACAAIKSISSSEIRSVADAAVTRDQRGMAILQNPVAGAREASIAEAKALTRQYSSKR